MTTVIACKEPPNQLCAFLDSIEGAGYGGMAEYEKARWQAHEMTDTLRKVAIYLRYCGDSGAELKDSVEAVLEAGYAHDVVAVAAT